MDMIETIRLSLRRMVPEDLEELLEIFTDSKVMDSFGVPPFTREQMMGWVERNLAHQNEHGYGLFSVILKSENRLIGDCGLEHMILEGQEVVELGYDLASRYWGQGLATEAAQAVRDYAFTALDLRELVSLIQTGNIASRRVSEKLGMQLRRTFSRNGRQYALYSITRDDGRQSP
jgi:ribosomal-protein-alanine N-acetyltransferase